MNFCQTMIESNATRRVQRNHAIWKLPSVRSNLHTQHATHANAAMGSQPNHNYVYREKYTKTCEYIMFASPPLANSTRSCQGDDKGEAYGGRMCTSMVLHQIWPRHLVLTGHIRIYSGIAVSQKCNLFNTARMLQKHGTWRKTNLRDDVGTLDPATCLYSFIVFYTAWAFFKFQHRKIYQPQKMPWSPSQLPVYSGRWLKYQTHSIGQRRRRRPVGKGHLYLMRNRIRIICLCHASIGRSSIIMGGCFYDVPIDVSVTYQWCWVKPSDNKPIWRCINCLLPARCWTTTRTTR